MVAVEVAYALLKSNQSGHKTPQVAAVSVLSTSPRELESAQRGFWNKQQERRRQIPLPIAANSDQTQSPTQPLQWV